MGQFFLVSFCGFSEDIGRKGKLFFNEKRKNRFN
jgi:hypothetical protein